MFTHLHVHTEYSLLDGMCRIPALLDRAAELGMKALAITDHGVLYGLVEFYEQARQRGIKPILGMEAYVAPSGRASRTAEDKQPYHLLLLARTREGYHNLLTLSTLSHLEGFYYRPRIDRELLEKHGSGLIALSGCLAAEVPRLLLRGLREEAAQAALWYQKVFDGFYLELQRHQGVPELERVNPALVELGRQTGIPLVATNDLHYVRQTDAAAHDLLLCIQTNAVVGEQNRMRMGDESFYLKSAEEMETLFADLPEAVENTQRIADMCDVELEFNRLLFPQVDLPPGKSSDDYLAGLCWKGFEGRYSSDRQDARDRLAYELDVVRQMEFSDYFLVVWDIVSHARRQGILTGVRGSAAASVVLYCLGITDLDPLAYGLIFERFLNLERKEMPDIDLDFQDDRRDEVIDYVTRKFGQDRVAQIITFGTLGAKAAIRDVGRALGMTYADVDRVARLIPAGAHPVPLEQSLEQVPALRDLQEQDPSIRRLIDTARELEGVARHASTHAAGVVISRDPLTQVVPLQRPVRGSDDGAPMTQWDMGAVAKAGLLKMDFLGLINLTVLARTRDLIAQTRGETIDLQAIPLDDEKTFGLLASGQTTGLFQLEGNGMRRYIQQLKPRSLGEISAMIALYRPGPMEHIPRFIDAKFGKAPIRYPHPDLAGILEETYGVIVYQDQVLLIVQKFAGYSLGQADTVRKAMGKKIPAIMVQERSSFVAGARRRGYRKEDAEAVFALIEPFAGYAFNKAHSVSYAFIAYQTAYFKANYPVEYMTALFNCHLGQQEKAGAFVEECQRLGIAVHPPDVSASDLHFTVEGDPRQGNASIRFGLAGIKNVGEQAVAPLVEERRRNGPYASLDDFVRRADLRVLNRRTLESLIKTGALDALGPRGALLAGVEQILARAQREQRVRESRQGTMFDLWGGSVPAPLAAMELAQGDVTVQEKLAWEKELAGAYFSEDPYRVLRGVTNSQAVLCGDVSEEIVGQRVAVAGLVVQVRPLTTKTGESFVSALLQDISGTVEVTVWPETYRATEGLWTPQSAVLVQGKVRTRGDRLSIACDRAEAIVPEEAPSEETDLVPSPLETRKGTEAPTLRMGLESSSNGQVPPSHSVAPPPREDAPSRPDEAIDAGKPPKTNGGSSSSHAVKKARGKGKEPLRHLLLRVSETADEDHDAHTLGALLDALRAFPGPDRVTLLVEVQGRRVERLEFPGLRTGYAPELAERLEALLGEGAVTVEERASPT